MSWIQEKFIEPLCHYYTLEATIVYGILFCFAVLGAFKLMNYLKIKIDKKFLYALLPFIIYGGWTRALRDHMLYQGWIWCSPPIYFSIFLITISSLILSILIQKKFKIEYYKTMIAIGAIFLLYNLSLTSISNFTALGMILSLIIFWAVLLFIVSKKTKILSQINAGIILAHLLDASSSFTSIAFFGYCEQHVLTGVLMGAYCNSSSLPNYLVLPFMPWTIFILKIVVVYSVLHLVDKYSDDKLFTNFLKIAILILGLALGIRDMLTVAML